MKLTLAHEHTLPTGVYGLATTPDGTRAFAACADGAIYSVDVASGQSQHALQGRHASYASGCVLLPGGRTLVSAGYDGMLLWHDTENGACWRRVRAHQFWSWRLALSPDGTRLATVTGQYLPGGWKYEPAPETEPSVKIFDAHTGDLVAAFAHTPPVMSCAFTPDGRHFAAANLLGDVRVWDLLAESNASEPVSAWNSPAFTSWGYTKTHHYCGGVYALAFSPDGDSLVGCGMGDMRDPMAGNGKMTWQRWNWRTGDLQDEIKEGQHGAGPMEALAWRPDGAHFLIAGRQAQGTWNAALFDAADGNLVDSIDTKKRITHAAFTADGATLIISGATGQGEREGGQWKPWGRLQAYRVS